jgi:hypothetical protein
VRPEPLELPGAARSCPGYANIKAMARPEGDATRHQIRCLLLSAI